MAEFLYDVLIAPLMAIYQGIFDGMPAAIGGMGSRIVLFSLLLNLALMPIYAQMERKSRAGRALRERVATEVERMKRHFKGRERYYYVRAVHRQFGYRPLTQLFQSADLMVQIVVFATVYHFLSGLDALAGESFGPLRDLSKPDALLGGINLMPFVMTAINAASVFAYVQDRGKRVQALGLALLFLLLLYQSPSGLVLYWTTNNLFSLCRTALQKRLAGTEGLWAREFSQWRRQT
jgi:membrane protein insertase Oxa1/YidC/SpoIIIJ